MVTLIFKVDQRKGQLQVKLGPIRSNFEITNFLTKTCRTCADLSQNSKYVIYFYVRQIEMQKLAFQKCDVITFTCFLGIAQAKTKILLWNFVCVLFVCISITHIPAFWITWNFRILLANISEKLKFWILGVKIDKYQKSEIAIL